MTNEITALLPSVQSKFQPSSESVQELLDVDNFNRIPHGQAIVRPFCHSNKGSRLDGTVEAKHDLYSLFLCARTVREKIGGVVVRLVVN